MDAGVERIVDQVVNPKIRSLVEPEVKRIINNYLGEEASVDEGKTHELLLQVVVATSGFVYAIPAIHSIQSQTSEEAAPPANGDTEVGEEKMSEKLSNISSEDIEMASAKEDSEAEEGKRPSTTGSPGESLILICSGLRW